MKELNKKTIKDLIIHLSVEYDVRFVDRGDDEFDKIEKLAQRLAPMGMAKEWLETHSCSLPGLIWLSFEPGDFSRVSAVRQIEIIAHELEHTMQWRLFKAAFAFLYLLSKNYRCWAERRALHATMQMSYALGGTPNIHSLASKLYGYRLDKRHVETATKDLRSHNKTAAKRYRSCDSVKTICKFLEIPAVKR